MSSASKKKKKKKGGLSTRSPGGLKSPVNVGQGHDDDVPEDDVEESKSRRYPRSGAKSGGRRRDGDFDEIGDNEASAVRSRKNRSRIKKITDGFKIGDQDDDVGGELAREPSRR